MVHVGSQVKVLSGTHAGKVGNVVKRDLQRSNRPSTTGPSWLYTVMFANGETIPYFRDDLEEIEDTQG
jgi:hypothetical protein